MAIRCEGCIVFHTRACIKAGVTRAELLDMLGIAVEMGSGQFPSTARRRSSVSTRCRPADGTSLAQKAFGDRPLNRAGQCRRSSGPDAELLFEPVEQEGERAAINLPQSLEELLLEVEDDGDDFGKDPLAFPVSCSSFPPGRGDRSARARSAALDQAGDGAADIGFVHAGVIGDVLGADTLAAAERGHHPPCRMSMPRRSP
ncbi:MAG: carboxymuconolactone decarboxylase family protein [Geminicoccaceae bacterium]